MKTERPGGNKFQQTRMITRSQYIVCNEFGSPADKELSENFPHPEWVFPSPPCTYRAPLLALYFLHGSVAHLKSLLFYNSLRMHFQEVDNSCFETYPLLASEMRMDSRL